MTTYNKQTTKISVVIPFYSNFDWLTEAINSVLKQTYQNIEIIVINDGSTEDDTNFIINYKDKIIYKKTINSGPAAARNFGIEIATGDFIAFLDSDDLWKSEKLEIQLKHIKEDNLIWSHTGYELFNDLDGKTFQTIKPNGFIGDVFLRCLISSPIATPCVMINAEFLRSNPSVRFAKNMRFGQDGYMWLNLARFESLGVVKEPLSRVRIRGANAALRGRVHLQVKAQIWEFIKSKSKTDKKFESIPYFIKLAYKSSFTSNKVILFLENKSWIKKNNLEFLSKLFYSPSFLILKIYSIKYK